MGVQVSTCFVQAIHQCWLWFITDPLRAMVLFIGWDS